MKKQGFSATTSKGTPPKKSGATPKQKGHVVTVPAGSKRTPPKC